MKRRILVCSAMLAVATALSAQATSAPATSVPAAVPAVAKGGPKRAEFRIGGFMLNGERSYDYSNTVRTATGQIKGVEVLMRAPGIGIYVRSLSGEFDGQPQVISADARLLLFPPVFTVFGGVGKRALSSSLSTLIYDVTMIGISSTSNIGGTGWRTHISGAVLISPDKSATGASAITQSSRGIEGEAAIFYRFPRIPLFFTVGYRTEIFTGSSGPAATAVKSPEEVRGVRIGGGIQFGGH
jgi:hypothetical protein